MGKGSSSDRARTRTTIGGHAAAAAVASDASTSTAKVVVVQAVMRIPPPSSQTSSRPGIATRKSEGGVFSVCASTTAAAAAAAPGRRVRENREGSPKRAARGERKNPTPRRHPSAPADRFFTIFFFSDAPFLFASALRAYYSIL